MAGVDAWLMCACDRTNPAHIDTAPDPAGGNGCGMAWRVREAGNEIEERHVTEVQPGAHLCQDVPAGSEGPALVLDPDGYPPRHFIHDGRAVWPLGEDGTDGILVQGHGPAAHAALRAHETATRNPDVDALLESYGVFFSPDEAIAGATLTERWAVFHTTCGCTQDDHDAHEDTWGGCDDHCANPDRPALPPCTPEDSPYCFAWGVDWVDQATPGALPVTEVAW